MEDHIIYPGETAQVNYWTKRWGIDAAQLHEAILQTGSLRVKEIREYLKKKKFSFTVTGIKQFIRLHL
jgi:hypothetical protein